MSEVETASTGFRRGGKQRSSLPVVRTPSKTLERPLGEFRRIVVTLALISDCRFDFYSVICSIHRDKREDEHLTKRSIENVKSPQLHFNNIVIIYIIKDVLKTM